MTCNEFKSQVIDLFDRPASNRLSAECRAHMDACEACTRYFTEMNATADSLRPRHSPYATVPSAPARTARPLFRRIWASVAAVVIFLSGIGVGLSDLFSTHAQANDNTSLLLEHFTRNLENVGNYQIDLEVRTHPDENFTTFDPEAPFISLRLRMLHQNGQLFWRVEKADGRTVVFDGNAQYLWMSNGIHIKGGSDANFAERCLQPENLLKQQVSLLSLTTLSDTQLKYTDQGIVLSASGQKNEVWEGLRNYRIETEFDKNSGLLSRMEVWVEHNGKEVQLIRSTDLRYNTDMNRADVVRLPEPEGSALWQDAELPKVTSRKARKALQKETAQEAARRILEALINNRPQEAEQALYNYRTLLPALTGKMKGCKVSDFEPPVTQDDYPGVFVFYRLTTPDGKSVRKYLSLRRDNRQRIWEADGGL